jgi:hypothetical protein
MFTLQKISIMLLCCTPFFFSCARKGCTDETAENFDVHAKKSDNTCTYKGSVVFWYGKETSQQLISSGATSLIYYFDNQLVGSTSTSVYFNGAPECGQNGTITSEKSLGGNKRGAFAYRVEDQLGLKRFEGVVDLAGAGCMKVELRP